VVATSVIGGVAVIPLIPLIVLLPPKRPTTTPRHHDAPEIPKSRNAELGYDASGLLTSPRKSQQKSQLRDCLFDCLTV
jgi:hypothetical protein